MFEAEVEMEKRSSVLPLLLMLCLVAAIVGLAGYVILQAKGQTPVTAQEATAIVAAAINGSGTASGPGPAIIHFRTGVLKPNADVKPEDPNYRLLGKAGIVKLAKPVHGSVAVSITPNGERLLSGLQGFKKEQTPDGTFSYEVSVAQRQFVSIAGINMIGPNSATVEYNWKWVPNQLGDVFDAGGSLVKSFNLWERETLINKYEVDFYNSGPTKSTIALVRNGKEWKIPGR